MCLLPLIEVPAGVPHLIVSSFHLPGGVQSDPGEIWQHSLLLSEW